jgi:GDP-L-galactose phosphorylase
VIPGNLGFVAQLNEGRHLKKRPTEFRVDCVLQPFDSAKFNFTKVGQEEVLFRFENGGGDDSYFLADAPSTDSDHAPNVVAINVLNSHSLSQYLLLFNIMYLDANTGTFYGGR